MGLSNKDVQKLKRINEKQKKFIYIYIWKNEVKEHFGRRVNQDVNRYRKLLNRRR